jgi:L-asparaginase II
MCGEILTPAVCGIDGCSAPNPVMQLQSVARGFSQFMNPVAQPKARQDACRRIYKAMTAHPDLVSGTGRLDLILTGAGKGRFVTKVGAEALHSVVAPEKDTVLVLKAEDGTARASQAALVELLERHKLADTDVIAAARPMAQPVLKNWRGTDVGRVRVAA